MKSRFIIYTSAILVALGLVTACQSSFLDITPNGALSEEVLATEDGVQSLLVGAYAMMDGVADNGFGWESAASNWVFGSIRALEGNKGTDAGDQPDINPIQTYTETPTNPYLNVKWRSLYEGISRANAAITVTKKALDAGTITAEQATSFTQQARGMRGHYHFELWKVFEKIPYVDENTDQATLTNTADVRDLIIADLQEASKLPNNMGQIGRLNGTVVKVIQAKALMQMKGEYASAKTLLAEVVASGTKPNGSAIGLSPNFGDVFDAANRNGIEAVYTVQYSVNDGSGGWNGGYGEVLNFPYKGSGGSPAGCCGFYQPTEEFVNSFRTDANGLPLLDNSYDNDPIKSDMGLAPADPFTEDAGNIDPRLDWSVGRRGIPYLDWGDHTGSDWVRDQSYAGPYSPKKQVFRKSQEGTFTEVGNWTSGWTANGYRMIRYADVLLLLAECEIQTNNLEGGRALINQIRARAANPSSWVKNTDGSNAANYVIGLYNTPFTDKEYAMTALMMERKLELGMEGHRFFDLKRWGTAQSEINRGLTYLKPIHGVMYGSATFGAEDVLYPVPQRQIDLSNGNLQQNR